MADIAWWRTTKNSLLWFIILSLLAFSLATVVFAYVFKKNLDSGQVLGVQLQNTASQGLSLYSGKVKLARAAENPAVYALLGSLKHPIYNEEVFNSYGYNFSDVKIISQRELDKYQLVRLVKNKESGKIYFLAYAQRVKKHLPNAQVFNSYTANQWANVVEASAKDLSFWNDAVLLKGASDPTVYFISGGNKAPIPSANEFINAGFSWNKILTVNKTDLDSYSNINFNINLVRVTASSGANASVSDGASVPSAKQIIVTIDSSSPAGKVFPFATAGNVAAAYKFQALSGSANISSLIFTKEGLLDINEITSVRVADENGVDFNSSLSVNSAAKTMKVKFNTPVVVSSAMPKILQVKLNFAAGTEANRTVGLSLMSAAAVEADAVVSGIFPLASEMHKLIAADNIIGKVSIESENINNSLREVNLGAIKETVAKFLVTETTGNEKASISKITFTNYGTAGSNDINNISLYRNGKLISAVKDLQNNQAVFNLAAAPIVVEKKNPAELALKVDILKGEDSTLKFVIDDPGDVQVQGLTQGFNLTVAGSFPIGSGPSSDYNKVAFKRIGIGLIATKMDDDDMEIFRAQENTILGEFELRNSGQDIYLQSCKLAVEKFNGAPDIADDIAVIDKKSKNELVVIDKNKVAGGVTASENLGNFKVAANATVTLWLVTKVPDNAQTNNAYQVNISELKYTIGLENVQYTQALAVSGQLMRVYAPRLAVSPGTLKNSGQATAGNEDVELASFQFAASPDEKIKIKEITASLTPSSDDATYSGGFSELVLYSGSSRVSQYISQPNSRSYTFSNLSMTVSANSSAILRVYADTAVNAAGKNIQFRVETVTAEGYSSKAPVDVSGEETESLAVQLAAPTAK